MRRKHRDALMDFADKGYDALAVFNAERYRGIAHTPEYAAKMAEVQARFNAEQRAKATANGWIIYEGPTRGAQDCCPSTAPEKP